MGAVLGGIIIILILSMIGAGNRAAVENNNLVESADRVTQISFSSPQSNSPSASLQPSPVTTSAPKTNENNFAAGKFTYRLPAGYRVASKIVAMDGKNAKPGFAALTITKGTAQQENDYVNLVNQIKGGAEVPPANELPQFLPGQTITVNATSKIAEEADARLSKGQEKLTTTQGNAAVRYVRVEGSAPYDSVYVKLADGRVISVQMSYGASDPLFDETAFLAVVNSIASQK